MLTNDNFNNGHHSCKQLKTLILGNLFLKQIKETLNPNPYKAQESCEKSMYSFFITCKNVLSKTYGEQVSMCILTSAVDARMPEKLILE